MLKKIIIFVALEFLIFFSIGKIFFDKRPPIEGKIDYFLKGLENPKLSYHLNLEKLHKTHNYLTIEITNSTSTIRIACYQILPDKLKITEECKEDLKIILDEHAISSIRVASWSPQSTLFSEFIFGHIKFSGLRFSDILVILT